MSENNTASGNLVCVSCTLSSCKKESVLKSRKALVRMLTSPLASFVRPDWLLNKGAMYFTCCQDFCRECG